MFLWQLLQWSLRYLLIKCWWIHITSSTIMVNMYQGMLLSVIKWSGSSGHRLYWFMSHEVTKSTVALCGQHVSPSQEFYKIPKIYMYRKGRQKSFGLQKITPTLIPLRVPLTFTCIWLRIWWGLLSLSYHITTSFSSSWLACGTWCSRGSWSCHYTWVRNQ